MSTAALAPVHVLRLKRPPPRAVARLRLEGSLAGVTALAPVIPIFPALGFSSKPRTENPKSKN